MIDDIYNMMGFVGGIGVAYAIGKSVVNRRLKLIAALYRLEVENSSVGATYMLRQQLEGNTNGNSDLEKVLGYYDKRIRECEAEVK